MSAPVFVTEPKAKTAKLPSGLWRASKRIDADAGTTGHATSESTGEPAVSGFNGGKDEEPCRSLPITKTPKATIAAPTNPSDMRRVRDRRGRCCNAVESAKRRGMPDATTKMVETPQDKRIQLRESRIHTMFKSNPSKTANIRLRERAKSNLFAPSK